MTAFRRRLCLRFLNRCTRFLSDDQVAAFYFFAQTGPRFHHSRIQSHSVDVTAVIFSELGRPEGYFLSSLLRSFPTSTSLGTASPADCPCSLLPMTAFFSCSFILIMDSMTAYHSDEPIPKHPRRHKFSQSQLISTSRSLTQSILDPTSGTNVTNLCISSHACSHKTRTVVVIPTSSTSMPCMQIDLSAFY